MNLLNREVRERNKQLRKDIKEKSHLSMAMTGRARKQRFDRAKLHERNRLEALDPETILDEIYRTQDVIMREMHDEL